MEENENGKFLRTVLRKDVHDRLTDHAKHFTTGTGKWDYGVAIQHLIDFHKEHSTVATINAKLDVLLSSVYSNEQMDTSRDEVPEQKEDPGTEMLGGEIIKHE